MVVVAEALIRRSIPLAVALETTFDSLTLRLFD